MRLKRPLGTSNPSETLADALSASSTPRQAISTPRTDTWAIVPQLMDVHCAAHLAMMRRETEKKQQKGVKGGVGWGWVVELGLGGGVGSGSRVTTQAKGKGMILCISSCIFPLKGSLAPHPSQNDVTEDGLHSGAFWRGQRRLEPKADAACPNRGL